MLWLTSTPVSDWSLRSFSLATEELEPAGESPTELEAELSYPLDSLGKSSSPAPFLTSSSSLRLDLRWKTASPNSMFRKLAPLHSMIWSPGLRPTSLASRPAFVDWMKMPGFSIGPWK